jgi:hypothetical protein
MLDESRLDQYKEILISSNTVRGTGCQPAAVSDNVTPARTMYNFDDDKYQQQRESSVKYDGTDDLMFFAMLLDQVASKPMPWIFFLEISALHRSDLLAILIACLNFFFIRWYQV